MKTITERNKLAWLRKNTFYCERLDARLPRSSCEVIRQHNGNQVVKQGNVQWAHDMVIPGLCGDCNRSRKKPGRKKKNYVSECLRKGL